jgi:phosphoglycerol transferase MdoB-like AlkP superfamily enzyme
MKINEAMIRRKVVPILLWITVPLLFLADTLLIQDLIPKWANEGIIDKIFVIFVLSFIFLFACFLLVNLIKHKKWLFQKNNKVLDNKFRIFGIIFFICLIVFPAIEIIFYKKWDNSFLLIMGAVFLLMNIIRGHRGGY